MFLVRIIGLSKKLVDRNFVHGCPSSVEAHDSRHEFAICIFLQELVRARNGQPVPVSSERHVGAAGHTIGADVIC